MNRIDQRVQNMLHGNDVYAHLQAFRAEVTADRRASCQVDLQIKKARITVEGELMQIVDACHGYDLTPGQADAIRELERCISVLQENEMFSGGRGRLR